MLFRIKPGCPFCGGVRVFLNEEPHTGFWFSCFGCEASGPIADTEELAKKAWGQRAMIKKESPK